MLLDYTRLEILKAVNAFLGTKHKFVRCKDVGMQDYLLKFEAGDRIQEYKFGVLYCKENQTDEYDMFGNGKLLSFIFRLLGSFMLTFVKKNMVLQTLMNSQISLVKVLN